MKTLRYILIFLIGLVGTNSCLVDDTTRYDLNDDGPNLAGFELNKTAFSFISDGNEKSFTVKMKVIGPTVLDVSNSVTVTVAADESSTAIDGTHFRLDNPTITLEPDNNLLGLLPITILTDGIVAPLDVSPVLVLNVASATGDPSVINNGKKIEITLNYGCFSNLAGTYTLDIDYDADGVPGTPVTRTDEVITETGIGTYRTTYVGHWTPAALAPGTPGFTFTDVCNVLTIPEQLLADYWANIVEGTDYGSVDPGTGDLYMEYSVCYGGACRFYRCDYTKQ